MNDESKSLALRLADELITHAHFADNAEAFSAMGKAAAELRRLAAVEAECEALWTTQGMLLQALCAMVADYDASRCPMPHPSHLADARAAIDAARAQEAK